VSTLPTAGLSPKSKEIATVEFQRDRFSSRLRFFPCAPGFPLWIISRAGARRAIVEAMRALLAFLVFMTALPVCAESVERPKDMVACQLSGWSNDTDPAGLNIRSGPSGTASVIARLKQRPENANGDSPEFHILGFKDGWFLIEGANYGSYGDPPPKVPPYGGAGWVHGSKLGGELTGAGDTLRTAPDPSAPILARADVGESIAVKALIACQGSWVKISSSLGAGWAPGLCSNQVTTCP
jgi:hypothetical protein